MLPNLYEMFDWRCSLIDKERNQPGNPDQEEKKRRVFLLKSNTIRGQNTADPTFSPDSDLAQGCRGTEMESRGAARRSCGEDATHSREWVPRRGKKNLKISHYCLVLCFYSYFYFYFVLKLFSCIFEIKIKIQNFISKFPPKF